jgi:hypothetical protein
VKHPWANLTAKDPPIQPSCVHTPTCLPFMIAPRCSRCGGELVNPCKAPAEGETRDCFMGCGGRYTLHRGAWFVASELPEQYAPPKVYARPRHLRSVA